jgi:hypothetical protein
VSYIRDQLSNLNDVLYSLKTPPSISLMESLFVFLLQDKTGEPDFDLALETRDLLSKAEDAINVIKEFNQQIPLTLIIRCATRNPAYLPSNMSGGEDWFTVYREYWKQYIEDQFIDYTKNKHQKDMLESFRYFLKGMSLSSMKFVESEDNPEGMPIREAFTLSFLLTFHSVVFVADINKILRPLLLEGEFTKRETRTIFTESYNDLMKLDEKIKKFDFNLSPEGDFGKQYETACSEMSITSRRRKVQMVIEEADDVADEIVEKAKAALGTISSILNGISKKDKEGKNEIISNMTVFIGNPQKPSLTSSGGTAPSPPAALTPKGLAFFASISDVIQSLQKASQILQEIDIMEGQS